MIKNNPKNDETFAIDLAFENVTPNTLMDTVIVRATRIQW